MKRTITLPTIDHGMVNLAEPSWCTGHGDHIAGYRVDIAHSGPEHHLMFEGDALFSALLTQDPFASVAERRRTGLYVEQAGYAAVLDAGEVRKLAATLTVHAMRLRQLADELATIQAEEADQ
ncbi:DUF6907 domain-containing protein [Streptomyces cinereoruber]|uniref:DUF6907 domain-containing protein n=1 Tax=Streptomyces cinereoruber TaxID=67260 RepID=UPI003392D577